MSVSLATTSVFWPGLGDTGEILNMMKGERKEYYFLSSLSAAAFPLWFWLPLGSSTGWPVSTM